MFVHKIIMPVCVRKASLYTEMLEQDDLTFIFFSVVAKVADWEEGQERTKTMRVKPPKVLILSNTHTHTHTHTHGVCTLF